MNPWFAAGLFDNPWIIAVIFIVGALANWLSQRRQEKQAGHPAERERDIPPPSSGKPPGEFNLEETLRRLMGEEPPAPGPAPPLIPGAAEVELPPVPDWPEEQEQAARRFEPLNEQGRHPATVVGRGRGSRAAKRTASRWRDPRSARQAFVASMVFAPPKSLEP